MTALLLTVSFAAGAAAGFAVARVGTWVRISQMESELRWLATEVGEEGMFNGRTHIPVAYVQARLDQIVRREFR